LYGNSPPGVKNEIGYRQRPEGPLSVTHWHVYDPLPRKAGNKLEKDRRISKEYKRIRKIYKDLPGSLLTLYDGLIRRAAYMRVTLEDYEVDLDRGGYVEMFTQSEKIDPYERERPVARLYNAMVKNYQVVMKQLADKLPEQSAKDLSEEILRFAVGGKK
jgi:hypothetical protein